MNWIEHLERSVQRYTEILKQDAKTIRQETEQIRQENIKIREETEILKEQNRRLKEYNDGPEENKIKPTQKEWDLLRTLAEEKRLMTKILISLEEYNRLKQKFENTEI